MRGSIQLPKPPMATGITKKKIIKIAWAVTTVLYVWSLFKYDPKELSSNRMIDESLAPTKPLQIPTKI